jgi:hypothetical protein
LVTVSQLSTASSTVSPSSSGSQASPDRVGVVVGLVAVGGQRAVVGGVEHRVVVVVGIAQVAGGVAVVVGLVGVGLQRAVVVAVEHAVAVGVDRGRVDVHRVDVHRVDVHRVGVDRAVDADRAIDARVDDLRAAVLAGGEGQRERPDARDERTTDLSSQRGGPHPAILCLGAWRGSTAFWEKAISVRSSTGPRARRLASWWEARRGPGPAEEVRRRTS